MTDPCIWYIYLLIYHKKSAIHVGKYIIWYQSHAILWHLNQNWGLCDECIPPLRWMKFMKKQNAPGGDFLIYKTLRCSHHLSPCVIKKNTLYRKPIILQYSIWLENHHVLVNLRSPCFGRIDACLNFIIKNHSCYAAITPPSRSIQNISKHRNFFIISNQKNTWNQSASLYISPAKHQVFFPSSLSLHFS